MEKSDYDWHRLQKLILGPRSKHEPSYYFHHNIRMTFIRDHTAILAHEIIGAETMMWGNDFPHHVSTWPHSKELLDQMFHDQPKEVRDAIIRDNVRALYQI